MLIVATTIHNEPAEAIVAPAQLERAATYSPALFAPSTPALKDA